MQTAWLLLALWRPRLAKVLESGVTNWLNGLPAERSTFSPITTNQAKHTARMLNVTCPR